MANSKYASTRETTNLARVARIILGPCTDVLCALLTMEICPSTLAQKVKTYLCVQPKRKQPQITKEQEKIIHSGNYSDFDITLLYFLLRNISNIPSHTKQWGNEPIPSDRSVSANIERIRLIRNKYVHCTDKSISDTDFNKKVLDISSIIQDLEKYLGTSTVYHDAVVEIGNCCMDSEQESKYIKELLNLNKKIKDISEKTTLIENRCVPKNVTVLYKKDSLRWEEDDKVFFETHNFPVMLDQVRNQKYITFVGAPGSGKTASARHIALKLQNEGYEICPVKEINKIEDYCNRSIPQVFVIDDVLGVFGLNEHELHMINKYSERLRDPINPKTKTLMTCREAVFKNEKISECVLVKPENVVNLQSMEHSLNDDDKQNLLQTYKLDKDLLSSRNLASSSRMFPFLCKLYSNKKELKFYGPTFFSSPVPCIIKEMNSLKIHNKLQYASLVLLMVNGNRLSENILNNENDGTNKNQKRHDLFVEMKRNILRKCKVSLTTESFDLIDALLQMEGTYTKKNDNEFTFIHDSMFEIIAYHFGKIFPELILKYASSDYIANYIKIDQNTSQKRKIEHECKNDKFSEENHEKEAIIDLCIHLHESQNQILAERLFQDVQDKEFYNVFGNKALKSKPLLQSFIAVLEKHSYYNIHSLLLTELEDSTLCIWNYEPKNAPTENMRSFSLRYDAHFCVMNEKLNGVHKHIRSVRGIAWIILFGHHQILQYILSQMIKEIGNVDDLFVNSFNKHFNMNQDVIEQMGSFNQSAVGEALKIENNIVEGHRSYCDQDRYTVAGAESETHIDAHGDTSVGTYYEPVIIEQCRLLCLGCYSGDINTLQILLQHVNADTLNYEHDYGINYWITNPLIIACKCGFPDIVMELLKAGADVSIYDRSQTPLTAACENGETSIVRALLKAGADVNGGNGKHNNVCTPLEMACKGEFMILVEELIKANADVNLNVPLINACIKGNLCIVKTLIKAGADVNRSNYGVSPLLVACINGHFNVVKKLIKVGADVNVNIKDQADRAYQMALIEWFIPRDVKIMMDEITPLIAACDYGYFKILKLLLKSGAKVDQKNNEKTTQNFPSYWDHLNIVKRLIQMKSNVDHNNTNERSLITACDCGQLDVVKQIIKGGADVNMKDGDKTPLIVACFKKHLHVVKELIKAGADVNLENEFMSPLQVACYKGHLSIVKELNKAGFDYNHITGAIKGLMGACFFGHTSVVKELTACHVQVNLKYKNETPLTTASFMGHLNIFKELIKAGADVNLTGSRTPLTLACYRGHISIVRELIKNGAFVNQSDKKETSLSIACERGHDDVVEELIKAGADVNQSDGNKTPLTTACEKGHDDVVEELIKAGADVNQSDGNKTPLTTACESGHDDVVEELIKAGADVNQSDGNKTPLTAACEKGHDDVVEELIKVGADVNQSDRNKTPLTTACEKGHGNVVEELIKAGADVNQSDGNKTPLTTACEKGHGDVVEELIKVGADVNQSDGNKTSLTTACEKGHDDVVEELIKAEGHRFVVRRLIEAGAIVNQTDGNKTPLTTACEKGHGDVVEELIKAGADVNQSDGNKTPLTTACDKGHDDVVEELIKAGADVNQSDGNKTPLTTACESGHDDVVEELIKAGADVNQSDGNKTPLTAACEKGHDDVVEELIKAGADVNQSDRNKTPLTTACEKGHGDVVEELIKAGADVNQSDGNKTPLTTACEKGHGDVVEELIKVGADVNQSDGNKTSLTTACEKGHDDVVEELIKAEGHRFVVRRLIEAGAIVNQTDGNKTPLTTACEKGHGDVVEELIKAGADVNQSDGNKTPITAARDCGSFSLIHLLKRAGADVNQK